MIDLKMLKSALEQLEEEKNIPRERIIEAIEDSLVAAYKKDYGKKGQIIKAKMDLDTGQTEFYKVKLVVDESLVRFDEEEEIVDEEDDRIKFNEESHITLEDAKRIKTNIQVGEEIIFPLDTHEDYGRIAAQTAKQVIIQKIREAEKDSIWEEYSGREGEILSGKVQKMERGNVYVDLGRTLAILPYEEQIRGEYYRQGERIRAYLYEVEETPRGVVLRLSRSHPKFVEKLFEMEAPEIATGTVEIKAIAREAGGRTKMAVWSEDPNIDPIGSCVGQKGSRVSTVINELGGEKIDIIEWSPDPDQFITNALSPAKILALTLNEEEKMAQIEVIPDQFSLAVGRGGQNARVAAKLTGWKINISVPPEMAETEEQTEAVSADPETEIDPNNKE
mgnify:CR=1 FL=1